MFQSPLLLRCALLSGALGVAVALLAPANGGTVNSGLSIDAGRTFALGGGQDGAFTVGGRNTGPVAVEVLGRAEGAATPSPRGMVAPGEAVEARFAAGETALFRNTSDTRKATLSLRITGDTGALGMAYSPRP